MKAALYDLVIALAKRFKSWSRPLFGTDAPLHAVVNGYAALRRNRRAAPVRPAAEWAALAERIDSDGLATLARPLDPMLTARVAGRFEQLTHDAAAWTFRFESSGDIHDPDGRPTAAGDGRIVQRDLVDPLGRIPEIIEFLDEPLRRLLEACYRTHFRLDRVAYWRNYHVPPQITEQKEVGYSHYWHNDGHPVDMLKLFIVMTDVSEEDGPFHALPKSVSRRIVRRGFDRKRFRHGDESLERTAVFKLVGPRGTAALCNTTLCLHRAGVPAPGRYRDLLQFQFRSHSTPWAAPAPRNVVQ